MSLLFDSASPNSKNEAIKGMKSESLWAASLNTIPACRTAAAIAKNIVAKCLADKIEVALAYYIGAKEPVNFTIDTFGTGKKSDVKILEFAGKLLVPSVKNIIEQLDLKRPIYLQTTAYGHFGKQGLPWEEIG